MALGEAMFRVPLESPRPDLTFRVKARIARQHAPADDARWLIPASALIACALLIALGLYFEVAVDPQAWWLAWNQAPASPEWMLNETALADGMHSLERVTELPGTLLSQFSPTMLWATLGIALAAFIILNSAEVLRLRSATPYRNNKPTDRWS